jgi:hypothetical protein
VDAHAAPLRARQLTDSQYDLADVPGTPQLLRQEMLVDWAEDWIACEPLRETAHLCS